MLLKVVPPVPVHKCGSSQTFSLSSVADRGPSCSGVHSHVMLCPYPQGGLLSALGSLAMMFLLAMTPHNSETEGKRLAILAGFAFLTGTVMMRTLQACDFGTLGVLSL